MLILLVDTKNEVYFPHSNSLQNKADTLARVQTRH
jgi:hypothetical protein